MVLAKDVLLVILQILPAVVISAGINFAVAYAMYHSQKSINFFPFPNTIAGDLAVTNFIQGTLNYLAPNITIELDSRMGRRVPWRGLWNPPLALVDKLSELKVSFKVVMKRLFFCILRGLFISVFLFLITWSVSVAIACPIYCGKNIGSVWAPQAIKGLYGGIHALIEIPVVSFLIVLGIDVRNHGFLPTSSADRKLPAAGAARPNSSGGTSGSVGPVVDNETGRVLAIDTRTNEPLRSDRI